MSAATDTGRPGTGPRPDGPAAPSPDPAPGRLLLVTGSMGAGHHAAARAVRERARELWPGIEVAATDTLAGMGPGAAPLMRGIYAGCVRHLPWLYALYYRLLCRVPPFRAGTRAVVGAWTARGLARELARHRPDLVVATFPEGITGLARLRRRGRLDVPAVALVVDPAPHPLWADPGLDLHLVSTQEGARRLARFAPGARVRVAAPPVARAFVPPSGPRRPGPTRVLVSCGSLTFGDVPALCAAVLDAGADVHVGAGRDARLEARLARLGATHPRGHALRVSDWIDDPAAAARACDVVVTTAGGATALEAVACARPLLLVAPVPGHGVANAAVLAAAGLARICSGPAELTRAVRELGVPERHAAAVAAVRRHLDGHDLSADVASLAALRPGSAGLERVRPQDAFFLHAATPRVPQTIGAVLVYEGTAGDADRWPEHLRELVRTRGPDIPLFGYGLAPARRGRLRWRVVAAPDPDRHVRPDVVRIGSGAGPADRDAATEAFFGEPIDPGLAWELQVTHEPATGRIGVLARAHHMLGDGLVLTDSLVALLADAGTSGAGGLRPARRDGSGRERRRRQVSPRRVLQVARGFAHLATDRPAGRSPLTGPVAGPAHRRRGVTLDGARVRAAARAHGVGTTAVLLALLAEALHATFAAAGTPTARVRTMVPLTTRTRAGVGSLSGGNRTAVLPVDLPTAPMAPAERVAAVAGALAAAASGGRPEAAEAAVTLIAGLPRPLGVPLVRLVHSRRFFHMMASVMPGVRRPLRVRGALMREIFPVLPLAGGVGLAVGACYCGTAACLGITADPSLVPGVDELPGRLQDALAGIGPDTSEASASPAVHPREPGSGAVTSP